MSKVRVLGGSGYLGRRIVSALRRVPGLQVESASRSSAICVDVTRPETWSALDDSALVIDVSDATRAAPDALIDYCLSRSITVVETTSDAPCVERLHQRFRSASAPLILGGGIFTGVSNLLARAVLADAEPGASLQLAIASSPFSGAGASTVELMVETLRRPVVRYVDGARVEDDAMSRGPKIDFGAATRSTLVAPFAEAYMLHHSAGAKSVQTLFSPRPGWLVPSFLAMPRWVGATRVGRGLLRGYFTVLRRVALARVRSVVELCAIAQGPTRSVARRVIAPDGMAAAAWALAAMSEQILARPRPAGAVFIDDVCSLDAVVARANELAAAQQLQCL